jgi:2-oxoglutarate dehydrogenase E2 component (dihydrolipoamide succinyltransferase)
MPIEVKVPELGESVKQATLLKWHKNEGQAIRADEPVCELETDKANVDVPAPGAGVFHPLKKEGDQVNVGEVIAQIDAAGSAAAPAKAAKSEPAKSDSAAKPKKQPEASAPPPMAPPVAIPSAARPPAQPAPGPTMDRKRDVATVAAPIAPSQAQPGIIFDADGIHRAPMSKIRKRIAQTLVQAQQTAAILTTFNEVDLSSVIDIRNKFKDRFQEVYGVGLGFMSFFARASVLCLKEFPRLNAFLDGDNVVYHQFVHLGIAVSTDRGLAVPILRHAEKMSFARIEAEVKRLANATREGKLSIEELSGGTFTITNGGIFGSLLSTPILNPPQSGILGMHAIQKRPVAVNDKIEIRSMMYTALSYDHRLVDGQESVRFLVRLKQYLEDPARLMLEI